MGKIKFSGSFIKEKWPFIKEKWPFIKEKLIFIRKITKKFRLFPAKELRRGTPGGNRRETVD